MVLLILKYYNTGVISEPIHIQDSSPLLLMASVHNACEKHKLTKQEYKRLLQGETVTIQKSTKYKLQLFK